MFYRQATCLAAAALTLLAGPRTSFAQAARVPASLELTTAREAAQGTQVEATIRLRNYRDEAVAAVRPIDVTITSALLDRSVQTTVAADRDSARATLVFNRAGIARLQATAPGLAAGYAVVAVRSGSGRAQMQVLFRRLLASPEDLVQGLFAAEPDNSCAVDDGSPQPGGLWLTVLPPRVPERDGRWSASLVIGVVNDRREPIAAERDIDVRLGPTIGTVADDQIVIAKGTSSRELRVTSRQAGCDTIYAWSSGASGVPRVHVAYEASRPTKVAVSPTVSEAVANGRAPVPIGVLLKDDDNHVVRNPDPDVRVVLHTNLGVMSGSVVTVARGQSDSDAVLLTSRRRGHASITASAAGLDNTPEIVTFTLPWMLMLLAAGGGAGGAVLRAPRRRRRGDLMKTVGIGAAFGFVFYGLVLFGIPGVLPGVPLDTLENLTMNEIGAVLLGLFGGYGGRYGFEAWFTRGRLRPSAAAAA